MHFQLQRRWKTYFEKIVFSPKYLQHYLLFPSYSGSSLLQCQRHTNDIRWNWWAKWHVGREAQKPLAEFSQDLQLRRNVDGKGFVESSTRAATSWCQWSSTPSSPTCPSSSRWPRSAPWKPTSPSTTPLPAAFRSWVWAPGISGMYCTWWNE